MISASSTLGLVKFAHTAIWAFFAGCIFAIPVFAHAGSLRYSAICSALVAAEVLVLAFNSWRCPLTAVASRYTGDTRDNFDIYLPEWLARHNKTIFGLLYVAGLLFLLYSWSAAGAMETRR